MVCLLCESAVIEKCFQPLRFRLCGTKRFQRQGTKVRNGEYPRGTGPERRGREGYQQVVEIAKERREYGEKKLKINHQGTKTRRNANGNLETLLVFLGAFVSRL
jgi:hypothetical protein